MHKGRVPRLRSEQERARAYEIAYQDDVADDDGRDHERRRGDMRWLLDEGVERFCLRSGTIRAAEGKERALHGDHPMLPAQTCDVTTKRHSAYNLKTHCANRRKEHDSRDDRRRPHDLRERDSGRPRGHPVKAHAMSKDQYHERRHCEHEENPKERTLDAGQR